jgi:hypothetical protein
MDLLVSKNLSHAEVPMIVLVTGGRDYADRAHVFRVLDALHRERGITRIVHGGARGVDSHAHAWALVCRVEVRAHAMSAKDWKTYGRAAGVLRNSHMLRVEEPELVVAFPGGRGTADMVSKAINAGVEVHDHRAEGAVQPAPVLGAAPGGQQGDAGGAGPRRAGMGSGRGSEPGTVGGSEAVPGGGDRQGRAGPSRGPAVAGVEEAGSALSRFSAYVIDLFGGPDRPAEVRAPVRRGKPNRREKPGRDHHTLPLF